jgi:hypothetical protein
VLPSGPSRLEAVTHRPDWLTWIWVVNFPVPDFSCSLHQTFQSFCPIQQVNFIILPTSRLLSPLVPDFSSRERSG